MSAEMETLCVPKHLLRQIKDALNQIAEACPDLDPRIMSAVNDARRELFAFFPTNLQISARSTDGPSYDEVFQKGFHLGGKAVIENYEQCGDAGIPSVEAFSIAVEWLQQRRAAAFDKLVDGADPECEELAEAFADGIELGINRFLSFVREDHDQHELTD